MRNFSCDMGRVLARSRWPGRAGLIVLIASLCCGDLAAQQEGLAAVPQARHLAAALSDQASRSDTLLTVAAAVRLLEYGRQADPARAAELETRFREERAWLDRLAARTADLHPRPSMLDPSAWSCANSISMV
jgi:hypothetical protein